MDYSIIILFIVLGILGMVLHLKQLTSVFKIFNYLLITGVGLVMMTKFDHQGQIIIYSLIAALSLNLFFSYFKFFRNAVVRFLVPAIVFGVLLLMLGSRTLLFDEVPHVVADKFVVLGLIVVLSREEVVGLLNRLLSKLLGESDGEEIARLVSVLVLTIGVYFSLLSASVLGLLIVSFAVASKAFYSSQETYKFHGVIAFLSILPVLILGADISNLIITNGDVLTGVILGVVSGLILSKLWDSSIKASIKIAAFTAILFMAIGFFFVGNIFALMGGVDMLISLMIGLVIAGMVVNSNVVISSLISLILAGAIGFPKLFVNEEQVAFEASIANEEKEDIQLLSLKEVAGSYSLVSDKSKVMFELGKEGAETNGAFKKVRGTVLIADKIEDSKLNISLALEDFTTFNASRDNSLMGDSYFKSDQFPRIKFVSKGVELQSENTFLVKGEFTMLGVTKELDVTMKRIKKGEKIVIIGSGQLNRVDFGMTPSASEGNVVSFNYEAELH
jgi:polyisoprenoid-binding protein YceI